MTKLADLTAYVFEEQPHLLSGELMEGMEASARFTAFVETYRDKIRKKVRATCDPESVLDPFYWKPKLQIPEIYKDAAN